ncbi:MAG: phosphatase PAP2-related protein [Verrucomicrobia bacterium]|nr:phosphatase PAP2-related protein [Verrucomicrobiota bacterium]
MSSFGHIGVRLAFVGIALIVWFWTQRLISAKAPVNNGVGDRLHDWTAGWHAWLTAHPHAANIVLIVTSALVDVFGVYLFASAVFGPTIRPFLAILIVFAMRQVCQAISTLPIPPGSIWRDPGFPSLLVTYGTSNDFFFSGHTAISILGALQLAHTAPPWLAAIGAVVAAVEAITVIVLRAHYTMDVFAALFAAWGADVFARNLAPPLDVWLRQFG